jgi:hypothetical protein
MRRGDKAFWDNSRHIPVEKIGQVAESSSTSCTTEGGGEEDAEEGR